MSKPTGAKPTIPSHEKPLPPAGESTRRMGQELVARWNEGPLLFAVFGTSVAFLMWWHWVFPIHPLVLAVLWSVLAVGLWAWALVSGVRIAGKQTRFEQGLEGERYVATLLGVPQDGRRYHAIHDLPGDEYAKPKDR